MGGGTSIVVPGGHEEDLAALTAIYDHYVVSTLVSFDLERSTAEQ